MKRNHYTISNGRLKRKDNTLYFIRGEDEKKQSLPIEQISNLHVYGEVDFNTKLMNFFSQHEIMIHIYNYYGFYAGSYFPRKTAVSGFTVVNQCKHYLDNRKRIYLAQCIVQSAVHHILRNLRRHKEKTEQVIKDIQMLAEKLESVKTVSELMGLEGNIRQRYYQSFGDIVNEDFIFTKRNKQPPRDPLNAMISFGNQLAYTTVLAEIYRTPLDPTISFLHEPSSKRFSLSLDLAEIFKPLLVDPLIFSLVNLRMINKKHFAFIEGEICYLNEEGKKKFISAWEERLSRTIQHRALKRKTSYRHLIRLECYKLIKHFIGDEIYKPLKAWW